MREEDARAEIDAKLFKAEARGKEQAELKAEEEKEKIILALAKNGVTLPVIAQAINKTAEEIAEIIAENKQQK
jgi:SOS response regulatory protein OraA/RecX